MGTKTELSEMQKRAVDHPHDSSAIVTAAAGSGKTTLLVARVIRLLSDKELGISADSLAIMTFTINATASMRNKLNAAMADEINKLAKKSPKSEEDLERYAYLKEQMIKLRQTCISTITSFCLRMIRENAEIFDLPLNFTIADNAKKATLRSKAMNKALQKFYSSEFTKEERNELFYSFHFEKDEKLREAIFSVEDKLSVMPDPQGWINNALNAYNDIDSMGKEYLPLYTETVKKAVEPIIACGKRYGDEDICNAVKDEIDAKPRQRQEYGQLKTDIEAYIKFDTKRINDLETNFNAFAAAPSFTTLDKLINDISATIDTAPESHEGDHNGKDAVQKSIYNKLVKEINKNIKNLLKLKIDKAKEEALLTSVQKATKAFFKLLRIYMDAYKLEKRKAGCIDFYDCERELYDKLNENNGNNEFRRQLTGRFSCIIVDEFQDSNNIQSEIFRLLGAGHLFYVGDVKQSIYAFRGADPYIMAELCRKFTNKHQGLILNTSYFSGARKSYKFRRPNSKTWKNNCKNRFTTLPLNKNYRSRKQVIDTVNAAFSGLMTPKFGGVEYSDSENKLSYGRDIPPSEHEDLYRSEIYLLTGVSKKSEDEEEENEMALPRFVARKIKELYENDDFLITDEEKKDESVDDEEDDDRPENNENTVKLRRLEYKDVIILLRKKTKINYYRKALTELGIPSVAPKGSNFFTADEVVLAHNYLKVIDNPMLNEEMLKVLMSPIYRFTAEEVAQLRMGILGLDGKSDEELKWFANKYNRRTRSLYSCILDCSNESDDKKEKYNVSPKLKRFYNDLKTFRDYMNSNSLDDLIRKIFDDTDLFAVVSAFEDSAGRVENIRQLQRLAANYEADMGGGLSDFLRYYERAKENATQKLEEAARPETNENAVRIMTYHGSKGLEAPVCIMSELQNTLNDDDYTGDMLFSFDHYITFKNTDIKRRHKTKTLPYDLHSQFIKERQLGDELRLLYVAMTRAQDKLIMVSSLTDARYKYLDGKVIPPAEHDEVYNTATPFKCVLDTLMQYAPTLYPIAKPDKNKGDAEIEPTLPEFKAFELDKIGCTVKTVVSNEYKKPVKSEEIARTDAEAADDTDLQAEADKITAQINTVYKHISDTTQQAKYTTTELAHKGAAKPIYPTRPAFARFGTTPSGVDKGNAYHHCMEKFPLDRLKDVTGDDETLKVVAAALDDMEKAGMITSDEREIVKAEHIASFFTNQLGKRLLCAYFKDPENVKREQSFYAEINGNEVGLKDYNDKISIQGQTDMYFIEDGKIVVVDYKSDTKKSLLKEEESYKLQVRIYTKILKLLTNTDVKEMYLYAFLEDEEIKI